jgi:hypothetical protein
MTPTSSSLSTQTGTDSAWCRSNRRCLQQERALLRLPGGGRWSRASLERQDRQRPRRRWGKGLPGFRDLGRQRLFIGGNATTIGGVS